MRTLGGEVSQSRLQSLEEHLAPRREKRGIRIEVAKDVMKKKEKYLLRGVFILLLVLLRRLVVRLTLRIGSSLFCI